jgi:uncharacterized membrane protein
MRMIRWVLWIVGGLVLGGIVHLVSVMWLPRTATQDAYNRLAGVAPVNGFQPSTRATTSPITPSTIARRAAAPSSST